jgi:hypothetical protein
MHVIQIRCRVQSGEALFIVKSISFECSLRNTEVMIAKSLNGIFCFMNELMHACTTELIGFSREVKEEKIFFLNNFFAKCRSRSCKNPPALTFKKSLSK